MKAINKNLLAKVVGRGPGDPDLPVLPQFAPIDPTLGKKQKKPDEG
ncbi:hypothetical protein L1285_22110 [Pseudoalteromonas sp. DL2-H2.2]|nr:hypothetical protein [Pseudoalteromonas sp. DL2-H2.2]MCF2911002.1 hypothetical protein [Pseudoalteromonas sp. DL2-H2.2]